MAYIGKQPSTKFSASAKLDSFTGDGSTTTFDLTNIVPAGGENGLQVYVDNVRQKPGSANAYTLGLDGSNDLKRITFTAAPDNGAEIYVIVPYESTNIKNVSDNSVTTAKLVDSAVTNVKVSPSAAIADTKLATISTAGKVATSAISQPGSSSVYLAGDGSWGAIDTSQQDTNAFNISLLGFKMAVNEGLTVFNLVDGVVDEFNDESGTDEAEGSNDSYCATSDFYVNAAPYSYSAGFTTTSVTEPDTSTAGTNPAYGNGTYGEYTVPTGITSINLFSWGAAGSSSNRPDGAGGGGGGFSTGKLAVTGSQTFTVVVGEGGNGLGPDGGLPVGTGALGGGGVSAPPGQQDPGSAHGGGLSGLFNGCVSQASVGLNSQATAPQAFIVAGAGGGGGYAAAGAGPRPAFAGGDGGGLIGGVGGPSSGGAEQTNFNFESGGGGSQTIGGQGGCGGGHPTGPGQNGALFLGGNDHPDHNVGSGGGGFYGGGGGSDNPRPTPVRTGGGGSGYIAHPQITCGSMEEGAGIEGGGIGQPNYVPGTNEGSVTANTVGEDGYFLITSSGVSACATSSTIVSTAFTATSVPTSARIVVFEENVDTPTLNTDIIASVSRDGGTTFTNATLSDSGYVTGSSGQRILTGQATISGQPSGQSMRWKLALANNQVRIHGVSLQWA